MGATEACGSFASWPMVLPYFDGRVSAAFPSPAEDCLEIPLDMTEYQIENKPHVDDAG